MNGLLNNSIKGRTKGACNGQGNANRRILFKNIVSKVQNKPRTAKVGAISKAQNLKGGPFGLCETPADCKKFLKIEGGPFGDMKKFPKKIF